MWMIYGANGYTGRLVAEEAQRRGQKPILAGRSETRISKLAQDLNLPYRVFDCQSSEAIAPHLKDIDLVLHCAGPFSATSEPMVSACLKSKTHYLDITGEIPVFEQILGTSERFQKAGIVAIPGVGFDVVPSDGLAALLKQGLPDANSFDLILKPSGPLSPGTLKTMLEGFYVGTVERKRSKLRMRSEFLCAEMPFAGRRYLCVGIPWGDVSSAYYSTQIPNIRVFLVTNPLTVRVLQLAQRFQSALKQPPVQKLMKTVVGRVHAGPNESQRQQGHYELWGIVTNHDGEQQQKGLRTPNGYTLTVDAALAAVERVLSSPPSPGAYTPSTAFGAEFALSLPGVEVMAP